MKRAQVVLRWSQGGEGMLQKKAREQTGSKHYERGVKLYEKDWNGLERRAEQVIEGDHNKANDFN